MDSVYKFKNPSLMMGGGGTGSGYGKKSWSEMVMTGTGSVPPAAVEKKEEKNDNMENKTQKDGENPVEVTAPATTSGSSGKRPFAERNELAVVPQPVVVVSHPSASCIGIATSEPVQGTSFGAFGGRPLRRCPSMVQNLNTLCEQEPITEFKNIAPIPYIPRDRKVDEEKTDKVTDEEAEEQQEEDEEQEEEDEEDSPDENDYGMMMDSDAPHKSQSQTIHLMETIFEDDEEEAREE